MARAHLSTFVSISCSQESTQVSTIYYNIYLNKITRRLLRNGTFSTDVRLLGRQMQRR